MEHPLVSVCITTFNHAPYIGRAIESVQRQRVAFPIEIIIGDDCSEDATLSIIECYAAKDSRIRVLRSERNEGMHHNYRRTLLAARGEWVALCDGDDFWSDDEKLTRQLEALAANPEAGMCYTRSYRFHEGAEQERWIYPTAELYTSFSDLLCNNTVENITAIARRELIEAYYAEIKPEQHAEWLTDDAPMWIWFSQRSRIIALDIPTASHRLLAESQSQSGDYRRRIAFCDSTASIAIFMARHFGEPHHIASLERQRMNVALWVLSIYGTTGEYLRRWWWEVCHSPRQLLNAAGYGLLLKRLVGLQRKKCRQH